MSEIKWFKVLTDIFSDDKIKIMQSMPEGDALIVMWFKVLAQAGKTNDGGYIYLKKSIPYTAGMLATLFNKPQQIVELAIRTFTEFGMIDMDDRGYIFITNWEKHQNIEGMDKVREKTRMRVAAHRQKKQLELMECNVTGNVTVTRGNATDIELDIEKEKSSSSGENSFDLYQNTIGTISPVIQDMLEENIITYGEPMLCEAIREAARQGKNKLSYVEGILKRWHTDGKSNGPKKEVARQRDSSLISRDREIALNRWIESGGNPSEFEFGHASNH